MLSCLYLAIECLWDIYKCHQNNQYRKQCVPISLPETPAFVTKDVSILIPTISTPDIFAECMKLWLANNPKEIIIVTIPRDLPRVNELLTSVKDTSTPIYVLTVPRPGRRAQMSLALQNVSGSIVVYVDDDTRWPNEQVLPYLLAGFNDPSVGGVTGRQSAFVPPHRRKSGVLTASEIATMRALTTSSDSNASLYASEGTVWCLTGRTMLARAEALQSEAFYHALTHETWRGKTINTGDDGFVTHWLLNRGWKLAFQSAPEAEVFTLVENGPTFVKQLVRWRRSGFRTFLKLVLHEPGLRQLYFKHPGFALKIVKFLMKPIGTALRVLAWFQSIRNWPHLAGLIAAFYLCRCAVAALGFHEKHPWVGYHNLIFVIVMDNAYQFINFYVLLTLGAEGWLTRDDSLMTNFI